MSVVRVLFGRKRSVRRISPSASSSESRESTERDDMPASLASVLWLGQQDHSSLSARSAIWTSSHRAAGFTASE